MGNCKQASEPMDQSSNIYDDSETGNYHYREIIGNLMYLISVTIPDIVFAVGFMSRFNENPKKTHVNSVKNIAIHYGYNRFWSILFY